MPHSLRSTELDCRQWQKRCSTAASNSSKVAKKRLCVAMQQASFQTCSMGANCGLYGGRKSSLSAIDISTEGLEKYSVVVLGVVEHNHHVLATQAMSQALLHELRVMLLEVTFVQTMAFESVALSQVAVQELYPGSEPWLFWCTAISCLKK